MSGGSCFIQTDSGKGSYSMWKASLKMYYWFKTNIPYNGVAFG